MHKNIDNFTKINSRPELSKIKLQKSNLEYDTAS